MAKSLKLLSAAAFSFMICVSCSQALAEPFIEAGERSGSVSTEQCLKDCELKKLRQIIICHEIEHYCIETLKDWSYFISKVLINDCYSKAGVCEINAVLAGAECREHCYKDK